MHRFFPVVLAAGLAAAPAPAAVSWTGVNLAGAEFGTKPGVHGTNYVYPHSAEVDYFVDKGANVFRIPFSWERIQPTLGGPLQSQELLRLAAITNAATARGATVILDPHNYGRFNGNTIGSSGGPTDAQFADLWSRLATTFKNDSKVAFGLMNEPHGMPSTEGWVASANAAIAGIRSAGADNLILVPGVRYSGAHSWHASQPGQSANAVAMLDIVDPADNYAFEVHQYLDSDSSGTHEAVVSATVGAQRLAGFTNWLKTNGKRGFLGEFAVPNSTIGDDAAQIGDEAIAAMLDHMDANSDVWLGWTWWAAGPWWGNYMFTIEPTGLGTANVADRASMTLLQDRMAGVPEPSAAAAAFAAMAALFRRRRRR